MLPKKLQDKLDARKTESSFRHLGKPNHLIDFSSNDYLGLSKSEAIFEKSHHYLINNNIIQNGASGSRLLTGNHELYTKVEQQISLFHKSESALIFNSGYDANLGFFSSIPQRNDVILYDEFCHASIRDGIAMSRAKAYKFKHNDVDDLALKCKKLSVRNSENVEIYIVTESVFSMDGDTPDLRALSQLCKTYGAKLIVDEAHAIGVFGHNGNGLCCELEIEELVFARIVTFGKAIGCHGAAILGSTALKDYLINFSRPFIYTTGLPPHALATLKLAYDQLGASKKNALNASEKLQKNIQFFKSEIERLKLRKNPSEEISVENIGFINSDSAIQSCVVSGNVRVKTISEALKKEGFDVRAILSPTVPKGKERLRFCLHSYNSEKEITEVLQLLIQFMGKLV